MRLEKEKQEKEEFETKQALECFEQDFDNDTYIIFHDDNNGNVFSFPDNTDPLDNLAVVGTVLKRIGVFDQDNPKVKNTDPLIQMGNVFPLICPQIGTGNRFSIPSFGIFDWNNPLNLIQQVAVFDRDNPQQGDNDKGLFT